MILFITPSFTINKNVKNSILDYCFHSIKWKMAQLVAGTRLQDSTDILEQYLK